MLSDPLSVKCLQLSSHSAISVWSTDSFATVDVSPGRSVRVCPAMAGVNLTNLRGTLTIAHNLSNENKSLGVATDRILVRLDVDGLRREASTGDTVKAAAYLVISAPRGVYDADGSDFSPLVLLETLLGAVTVNPSAATLSETNITRILAGEP